MMREVSFSDLVAENDNNSVDVIVDSALSRWEAATTVTDFAGRTVTVNKDYRGNIRLTIGDCVISLDDEQLTELFGAIVRAVRS
jgi:hypothetical protein